jgi:hypothetical protein
MPLKVFRSARIQLKTQIDKSFIMNITIIQRPREVSGEEYLSLAVVLMTPSKTIKNHHSLARTDS